jgi:hypothetical protein
MGALLDLAMDCGADSPDPAGTMVLSAAQESARRDVLARLQTHPAINRTFVTRWESDTLIVTLGVRGIGTCELAIPGERFNRESLADYDALLTCLSKAEGHA